MELGLRTAAPFVHLAIEGIHRHVWLLGFLADIAAGVASIRNLCFDVLQWPGAHWQPLCGGRRRGRAPFQSVHLLGIATRIYPIHCHCIDAVRRAADIPASAAYPLGTLRG